jgi:thiol-disulfide isomerase/thioredoxin
MLSRRQFMEYAAAYAGLQLVPADASAAVRIGSILPNGRMRQFNKGKLGKEKPLSSILSDGIGLIAFGSSTCRPCLIEKKLLNNVHDKYKDRGLQVVGIETGAYEVFDVRPDITLKNLEIYVNLVSLEVGNKGPIYTRNKDYIARFPVFVWTHPTPPDRLYSYTGEPTTFIVRKRSNQVKLLRKYSGLVPEKKLERAIRRYL